MTEKTKPTVEELEAILNDPRTGHINMNPDGSLEVVYVETQTLEEILAKLPDTRHSATY